MTPASNHSGNLDFTIQRMPESENHPVFFRSLDREAPIDVFSRNLPHWYQPGVATFVTFRTADSLPKHVIARLVVELVEWLNARNLPLELAHSTFGRNGSDADKWLQQLDQRQQRNFKKLVNDWMHRSLDECYGDCLFRRPELAEIVANAIRFFDGERYDVDSFVVMPNHVHAIVQFRKGFDLRTIGLSWMRYTARVINQQIGRSGILWKPEPFDHLIRSPEQFHYLQGYIRENPTKAKLRPGEYLVWNRFESQS